MPSHIERAEAAWKGGRITETVVQFNRAIAMEPQEERAYLRLAQLYLELDRADLTLETLELLRTTHPQAPHACLPLAQALLKVGDTEEALKYAKQALLQEPQNADAHLIYGLVLESKNRLQPALEALQKAQTLAPTYLQTGLALVDAYQKRGDYRKSMQLARDLVNTSPRSPRLYFLLGVAYRHLGTERDLSLAEKAQKEALEIMPDWYEPYLELGRIAERRKQTAVALQSYEKAWELNPMCLEAGEALIPFWRQRADPRSKSLDMKCMKLKMLRVLYEQNRKAEEQKAATPSQVLALAEAEAFEGRYEVALYRLRKLLAQDSAQVPGLRLYRNIDNQARSGYQNYLRPGPHLTHDAASH
jgi:tetratricopeptide (TPR) repeat protein